MNEIFLIVSFVLIILFTSFIFKNYSAIKISKIRIVAGVLFLILIWFLGDAGKFTYKIILTLILIYSLLWSYKNYKKIRRLQ